MNENTLVAVSAYAGDAPQVNYNLLLYVHHECPVVILTPEDSKIVEVNPPHPLVEFRHGGLRAYIGQESLDRQKIFFQILLTYPHKFFLLNDSDSVCMPDRIPQYLYDSEPDIVWSNEANEREVHLNCPEADMAMQPPYFFTREALERMVAVPMEKTPAHPRMPFIDHWMRQVNEAAGLRHQSFPDGVTFGTHDQHHGEMMAGCVRGGKNFIHSVKREEVVHQLIQAYHQRIPVHE